MDISILLLVEQGIVGEAGSTIEEEERVEFVCALDVFSEGLKHIRQLCATITEEVDEEVFLHCTDSELSKSTGLFSGMASTG